MSSALQAVPDEPSNPFPGLRPFEPDEDYLFFGRESQTDELLRKLRTTRFLAILGTSGSGKSSLVRSGLIPSLYGGAMTSAGSRWRCAIMRPGDDPLGNLAAALSAPDSLDAGDDGRTFFETTLRASNHGIVECIRQARISPRDNVLVLVDQFEELFRYKRSQRGGGRDEALAFVKLLLAARESDVPCYIALTMRSDFIGDCMEFDGLPEAINQGVYLVSRMNRDELRSAITGPVAVGGATIAPRLVSRLLNDVGDDPDQLPILQHALMRTWEAWVSGGQPHEPLDLRHYETVGTMRAALSRHAEEAFAELREDQQRIAEKLFKALTDKETDVRGVRRPALLREIRALAGASVAEVVAVVDRFREHGRTFLMPPAGTALDDDSILDISHESLMRVWTRLSNWADEESKSAQMYVRVAHAAELQERGVAALWRDPELQLALAWRSAERPTEAWAARYDPSFARAMAFLDASRAERDRELREKEARRRLLMIILVTASLVIAAFGVFALGQKRKAEEARGVAEKARTGAEQALVLVREERARADTEKTRAEEQARRADEQKGEADLQRINAERQAGIASEKSVIAESERLRAEAATLDAQAKARLALTEKANAERARGEAVDEKTKAVASETETRRLSQLAAAHAEALRIIALPTRSSIDAGDALRAERHHRVNGGRAEDADIFNAMLLALLDSRVHSWRGCDTFRSLVIAPDGRTVFAGCDDGNLVTFDLARDGGVQALGKLPGGVRALAARGDVLAIGTAKGRVSLRDLRHPEKILRELDAGSDVISSLAFQPNGPLLAAGSFDGFLRVWNIDDASPPRKTSPAGESARMHAVAFNADGTSLAVGTSQGGYVLRPADLEADARRACEDDVRSVAFGAGNGLACGAGNGKIMVRIPGKGAVSVYHLDGHSSSVNALSFDAGGDGLLSASSDGTVRLWQVQQQDAPPIVLSGHQSWVWAAVFASNGDRILSAGRTVRLWPAKPQVLAADLCEFVGVYVSSEGLCGGKVKR